MKLKEAKIYNFMPYKGEHNVKFPTDSSHNVMLIFGDNMRGKTSFLNTIRWCFYGKALGRHLKDIPRINIVNVDAAKAADWTVYIYLTFENDGDEYDLRRTMKLKPLIYIPKTNTDFEIEVSLRKNGSVLRNDQIQHELNQIIPEDIARFFLFDGELLQEYEMLLNDQDEQGHIIKESIEKILGVPALINGRNELDTLLKKARQVQARDTEHIAGLEKHSQQLTQLQAERESLENDLKDLEKRKELKQTEVDKFEQELEESRSIQADKERYDAIKTEIKSLEERQANLETEKLSILKESWKDLVQPRLNSRIYDIDKKILERKGDLKKEYDLEARINNLNFIISRSTCPTCEQVISEKKKKEASDEVGKVMASLEQYKTDMGALGDLNEKKNNLLKIKSAGAKDKIPRIDKELREISLRVTEYENKINELNENLKAHDTAEIARKRATRDILIKNIGILENDIKDRKSRIDDNEKKQGQLTKLMELNSQARAQKSSRMVHVYAQLKTIFEESINKLRDDLRTQVEKLSSESFKGMTTESTYSGLKINENYGLTIVDRERREVKERSAGAEQIVALALIDGLNKTARKAGPIIMDTPLGRLDLKHRENVLKHIPEMAEQIILLVHEGEIRKSEILDSIKGRIGSVLSIERVSSSESKLVRE